MNFSTDEEDNEFGLPSIGGGGSKLSSLFGMDRANNQGGNESLTFTAPKQPKKAKEQQGSQGGQSALLLAVAVHAYRFSNGTYIKHGKLGAAILGNHTANDYKILLYISKQQQVTHARITPQFAFTVQANNYATFYDEQRQNWSIMFESEQNGIDFAKQVGLAKVNSAGGVAKALVFQDLTIGLGDAVQSGDSVEVKYTGWLYHGRSFGDVFDSNTSVDKPFRFKIGKGKVIKGWEEGVVGMKKNGRRLLIVPPALAYGKKGLGSRIPPNSTLMFDVEVKKLKFSRDKEESGSLSSDATDASRSEERIGSPKISRSREATSDNESRIRHNNNSESPLSTSPSSSKAKLISRMAKMGQPMLPLSGTLVAHDSTDSEADEASASSDTGLPPSGPQNVMPKKAMKVPRKVHNNHTGTNNFQQSDIPHGIPTNSLQGGDPGVHGGHQVAIYQPQVPNSQGQPMPQTQPHLPHLPHQAQAPGMGMPPGQQPMHNYPIHHQQHPPPPPPPHQHTYYQPPQHVPTQPPGQNPMQHQVAIQPPGAVYPATPSHQALVQQQQMADVQMVPMLLSEARQHHSDIRTAVGKVSDRIEDLCKKVDHIQTNTSQSPLSSTQPTMEATALMTNIQRIVQENERLKREVYDKSARIDNQNEKISELLQKNQLYVEQSNSLLEKTNDSYKMTATQSQQRVLELEQEKVHMTSELSNATSKISSLQMELSNVQQRESQLRAQLNGALNNSQENRGELDQLKQQLRENDNKYTEVLKSLKDERQLKKQMENRVTALEEELSEIKIEKENLEKNLLERRRKTAAEKQKSEDDVDDMKRSYEDEINQIKSKLRLQKSSTDAMAAEQIAQVERELESQWRDRSDRLIQQTKDKHEREMSDLQEEKEHLTRKLTSTEQKMVSLRSNQGENKDEVENLKKQLEEVQVWKEKYESLHSSAVSMKERYETRIKELIQEKAAAAASSATIPQANVVDEVKKVMNNVYHSLRSEIDASESYKGAEVLNVIMNTIKLATMKLVQQAAKKSQQREEEDDEDEDEEEDEDEDEEEESEEEESEEEEEEEVVVKAPQKKAASKTEAAVPVMTAPPSTQSADSAASAQGATKRRVAVEEPIQREKEQVVESARPIVAAEEDGEEEKQLETEAVVVAESADEVDAATPANDKDEIEEENIEVENQANNEAEEDADDEDSQKESKKDDDDDFWSAEGSDGEDEGSDGEDEGSDGEDEGSDGKDEGVSAPAIVLSSGPPEPPPEPPAIDDDASLNAQEENKPRALSNVPSLPGELDMEEEVVTETEPATQKDEPDPFSPPEPSEDDEEEKEEEEEKKTERAGSVDVAMPTVLDREPPELPPELPPEDDEESAKKEEVKKDVLSSGIFGDDDDDDNLFSIPVTTKKKAEKKKPAATKTPKKTEEDDNPFKPGPPPPLFGDDDEDDLDWIS